MNNRVITVFGATGAQGGGLARAILADAGSDFSVRAVTRTPGSEAARALARAGAEVIAADLDDAGSVQRAMQGAYGAFCVTNFWEHFAPEKELARAGTMARAAFRAELRHIVWSTLEDTRSYFAPGSGRMPVLMGKYNVPHFDAKGEANAAFVRCRVPTTLLYTSGYWEHLACFGMGLKNGAISFPTGDKKIPWIGVEDIGKCAYGIFKRGSELVGKSIGVAGEHLSGAQMASQLGAALSRPIAYHSVTPEQYRASGAPGADELGNMFQFKRDFETSYCAARNPDVARELNPELQNFAQWLARNASRIPLD